MDSILIIAAIFVLFMIVWIIALFVGKSLRNKKLNAFKHFVLENLPEFDPNRDGILIAKQKSKAIQPDIALLINEAQREIIILQDVKGEGIQDSRYKFDDLVDVESSSQLLSRGLFPKTYSYEETLSLTFKDGQDYQLNLENLSNKTGDDQGAEIVRNIFEPWKNKLSQIADQ